PFSENRGSVAISDASVSDRGIEIHDRLPHEGLTAGECPSSDVVPFSSDPILFHDAPSATAPSGHDHADLVGETCSPTTAPQDFIDPAASFRRGSSALADPRREDSRYSRGHRCDWTSRQVFPGKAAFSPSAGQRAPKRDRRFPLPDAEQRQSMDIRGRANRALSGDVGDPEKGAEAARVEATDDTGRAYCMVGQQKRSRSVHAFPPEQAGYRSGLFSESARARVVVDRTATRSLESVCCSALIGRVSSIPTPSSTSRAESPAARFIAAAVDAIAPGRFLAEEMSRGSTEGLEAVVLPTGKGEETKRVEECIEEDRTGKTAGEGGQGRRQQLWGGANLAERVARPSTESEKAGTGFALDGESRVGGGGQEGDGAQKGSPTVTPQEVEERHSRDHESGVDKKELEGEGASVRKATAGQERELGDNSCAKSTLGSNLVAGGAAVESSDVASVLTIAARVASETPDETALREMSVAPNLACSRRAVPSGLLDCTRDNQKAGSIRRVRSPSPDGVAVLTTVSAKAAFYRSLSEVYLSSLLQPTEILLNRTAALLIGVLVPAVYTHLNKWFHNTSARRDWTSDHEFQYSCSSSSCNASVESRLLAPAVDLLPVFFSSVSSSPGAVQGMEPGVAAGVAVPPTEADDVAHFVFRASLAPENSLWRIYLLPTRRKPGAAKPPCSLESALALPVPAPRDAISSGDDSGASPLDISCASRECGICPGIQDDGELFCCLDSLLPFPASLSPGTSVTSPFVPSSDDASVSPVVNFLGPFLSSASPDVPRGFTAIPPLSFKGPPPCWCFRGSKDAETERTLSSAGDDSGGMFCRPDRAACKVDVASSPFRSNGGKRHRAVSQSAEQPGPPQKRHRLREKINPGGCRELTVVKTRAEPSLTDPSSALASFLSEEVPVTVYGFHVSKLLAAGVRDAAIALMCAQQSGSLPLTISAGHGGGSLSSGDESGPGSLFTRACSGVLSVEEAAEGAGVASLACLGAPTSADQIECSRPTSSLFWAPVTDVGRLLCSRDPPSRTRPLKSRSAGRIPSATEHGVAGAGGRHSGVHGHASAGMGQTVKQGLKTPADEEGIWVLRQKVLGHALAVRASVAIPDELESTVKGSAFCRENDGGGRVADAGERPARSPGGEDSRQDQTSRTDAHDRKFVESGSSTEPRGPRTESAAVGKDIGGASCGGGRSQGTEGDRLRPRLLERYFLVDAHGASKFEPSPARLRRAVHMAISWFRQKKSQRDLAHVDGANDPVPGFRLPGPSWATSLEAPASARSEEGAQRTELLSSVDTFISSGGGRVVKRTRLHLPRDEMSEPSKLDVSPLQNSGATVVEAAYEHPALGRTDDRQCHRGTAAKETVVSASSANGSRSSAVVPRRERGYWSSGQRQVETEPENSRDGRRRYSVPEEQEEIYDGCSSGVPTRATEDEATGTACLHALAHALVSRFLSVCVPCTLAASSCCCTLFSTVKGSGEDVCWSGDPSITRSPRASLLRGNDSCPRCALLLGLRWREDCFGFEYFVACCQRSVECCNAGFESDASKTVLSGSPRAYLVARPSNSKVGKTHDQCGRMHRGGNLGFPLANDQGARQKLEEIDQPRSMWRGPGKAAFMPAAGSSEAFLQTRAVAEPGAEGRGDGDMDLLLLIQHDVVQPCVFDVLAVQLTFRAALTRLLPFVTVGEEALSSFFSSSTKLRKQILSRDGCYFGQPPRWEGSCSILQSHEAGAREVVDQSRGAMKSTSPSRRENHRGEDTETPLRETRDGGGRVHSLSGESGVGKRLITSVVEKSSRADSNGSGGGFETAVQEDCSDRGSAQEPPSSARRVDGVKGGGERGESECHSRKRDGEHASLPDGTSSSSRASPAFLSLLSLFSSPLALVDALEPVQDSSPSPPFQLETSEKTCTVNTSRGSRRRQPPTAIKLKPPLTFVKKKTKPVTLGRLIANLLSSAPPAEVHRLLAGEGTSKHHRKRGAVEVGEAPDLCRQMNHVRKLEKKQELFESLLRCVGGLKVTCEYLTVTAHTLFRRSLKADILLALLFPSQQEIVMEKHLEQKRREQGGWFPSSTRRGLRRSQQKAEMAQETLERFLHRSWPPAWPVGSAEGVLGKSAPLEESLHRRVRSTGREGSECVSDCETHRRDDEAEAFSVLRPSRILWGKATPCDRLHDGHSNLVRLRRRPTEFPLPQDSPRTSAGDAPPNRARRQRKRGDLESETHDSKREEIGSAKLGIQDSEAGERCQYTGLNSIGRGAEEWSLAGRIAAELPFSASRCLPSDGERPSRLAGTSGAVLPRQKENVPGSNRITEKHSALDAERVLKREGARTPPGSQLSPTALGYTSPPGFRGEAHSSGHGHDFTSFDGGLGAPIASASFWGDHQEPELRHLLLPTSIRTPLCSSVVEEQGRSYRTRVPCALAQGADAVGGYVRINRPPNCIFPEGDISPHSATKAQGATASSLYRSQLGQGLDEGALHYALTGAASSAFRLSPGLLCKARDGDAVGRGPIGESCADASSEPSSVGETGGRGPGAIFSEGDSSGTECTSHATWIDPSLRLRPGSGPGFRGIEDNSQGRLRSWRLETRPASAERLCPRRTLRASTVDVSKLRDGRDFKIDWRSDCDYGSGGTSDEEDELQGGDEVEGAEVTLVSKGTERIQMFEERIPDEEICSADGRSSGTEATPMTSPGSLRAQQPCQSSSLLHSFHSSLAAAFRRHRIPLRAFSSPMCSHLPPLCNLSPAPMANPVAPPLSDFVSTNSAAEPASSQHGRSPCTAGQLQSSVPDTDIGASSAAPSYEASGSRSCRAGGTGDPCLGAVAGEPLHELPLSSQDGELAGHSLPLHQQLEQVGRLLNPANRELYGRKKGKAGTMDFLPTTPERTSTDTASGTRAICWPPATFASLPDSVSLREEEQVFGRLVSPTNAAFSQHLQQEGFRSGSQKKGGEQRGSCFVSFPPTPTRSISATSTPSVPRSPDVHVHVNPPVSETAGDGCSPPLSSATSELHGCRVLVTACDSLFSPLPPVIQTEMVTSVSQQLAADRGDSRNRFFPQEPVQQSAAATQRKLGDTVGPGSQVGASLPGLDGDGVPSGLPSSQQVFAFLRQQNGQSPVGLCQAGTDQGNAPCCLSPGEVGVAYPAVEKAKTAKDSLAVTGRHFGPPAVTPSTGLVEATASTARLYSKSGDGGRGEGASSLASSSLLRAELKPQQQIGHQQLAVVLAAAMKFAERGSKCTNASAFQSEKPPRDLWSDRGEDGESSVAAGRDFVSGNYERRLAEAAAVFRALNLPDASSSRGSTAGFISDVSRRLLAVAASGGVAAGSEAATGLPQQVVAGATREPRETVTPEGLIPSVYEDAALGGAVSAYGGRGRAAAGRRGDPRTRDCSDPSLRPSSRSARRTPSPRSECSAGHRRGGGTGGEKGGGPYLSFPSGAQYTDHGSRARSPSRQKVNTRGNGRRNSSSCSEDSNVGESSGPFSPTPSSGNRTPRRSGANDDEELVPIGELPTGVYFDVARRLWRCQWREDGRLKSSGFSLKQYKTLEEAREACILYKCAVTNTPVNPAWLVPQYIPASKASKRNLRHRQASAPSTPQPSSTSNLSPVPRSEEDSEDSVPPYRGSGRDDAAQGHGSGSVASSLRLVLGKEEARVHHDSTPAGDGGGLCPGVTLGAAAAESATAADALPAAAVRAAERNLVRSPSLGHVDAAAGGIRWGAAAPFCSSGDPGAGRSQRAAADQETGAGLLRPGVSDASHALDGVRDSRAEMCRSGTCFVDKAVATHFNQVLQLLGGGGYKATSPESSSLSEATPLQPGVLSGAPSRTAPTLENLAEFIRTAAGTRAPPIITDNEKKAETAGAGRLSDAVRAACPAGDLLPAGVGGPTVTAVPNAAPPPGEGGSGTRAIARGAAPQLCSPLTAESAGVPPRPSSRVSGCLEQEVSGEQAGLQLRGAVEGETEFVCVTGSSGRAAAPSSPSFASMSFSSPELTVVKPGFETGQVGSRPPPESGKEMSTSSSSEIHALLAASARPTVDTESTGETETDAKRTQELAANTGLQRCKQEGEKPW
ncbi:ap2 domain transcription factor ap2viii-4, partial [Cystoisospora suis]